jgi:glycosyltransferase involved in cell wall biosynthesis
MWPSIRFRWERRLNRFLLGWQLVGPVRKLPTPRVLVTTIPLVADLMGTLPVNRWVYYCVDDFRHWPGMASKVIATLEVELTRKADVVIAAGQRLAQHVAELGRTPHLLTHGVDLEMWSGSNVESPDPSLIERTRNLERPWIVFWGSIDWQMDPDFIVALANRLDQGTLLFLGPVTDCDPIIRRLPRVVLLGRVPYRALPWFAGQASVLVMPYRRGPGLEEAEPLKLREYLATDRAIVARNLPANRLWQDALDLVDTPEEFASRVIMRIQEGVLPSQLSARARVQEEGWPTKARQFAAWLFPDMPS